MYKLLVIILITFVCHNCLGQTAPKVDSGTNKQDILKEEDDPRVFTRAEKSPEFPGGEAGWRDFLSKNLDANTPVKNGASAGTYQVVIRFIVNKNGSLKDFAAETGFGYGMEQEVIRILKLSPKWNCAMQNGYKVNFYVRQPVTFVVSVK